LLVCVYGTFAVTRALMRLRLHTHTHILFYLLRLRLLHIGCWLPLHYIWRFTHIHYVVVTVVLVVDLPGCWLQLLFCWVGWLFVGCWDTFYGLHFVRLLVYILHLFTFTFYLIWIPHIVTVGVSWLTVGCYVGCITFTLAHLRLYTPHTLVGYTFGSLHTLLLFWLRFGSSLRCLVGLVVTDVLVGCYVYGCWLHLLVVRLVCSGCWIRPVIYGYPFTHSSSHGLPLYGWLVTFGLVVRWITLRCGLRLVHAHCWFTRLPLRLPFWVTLVVHCWLFTPLVGCWLVGYI